ncbi:molybdopterin-dependent oxidoreductase [Pseudothauera rhizosphaerae]|uniref:molybdopterin-dependent oxidoreductase n=1 Tax=Pseudothauera rhizosphaerae TaxID=2565932 RepID=UPI001454C83D|nr:c-type cytochrome [Pseudothauera rhizosphaerae]
MRIDRASENVVRAALAGLAAAAVLVAAGPAHATGGPALAQDGGCLVCHRGAEQRIGPAFRDVAARYTGRADAETVLARHIIAGTGPAGQGWQKEGRARLPVMPANGNVTPEDARRLARWILGVGGEVVDPRQFRSASVGVSGLVAHPLDLDVAALRAFPVRRLDLAPAGGRADEGKPPDRFAGVLLRDILEKASVTFGSHFDLKKTVVVATATDGYRVVFTWSELFSSPIGDGALVFFEKNGRPLADDEGSVALLSAGDDSTASRYLKWLKTIEVRRLAD